MKSKMTLREARSSIRRLNALVQASHLLNSSLNLKRVLATLLDVATKNLDAERGTIYLLDTERRELWSQALKGDESMEIRLPMGKGIAGTVGKTGETVNLKDAYKDKRFNKEIDTKTGYRTSSMLCMPMKNRSGKIVGVFQILNKRRGHFDKNDEHFLSELSIPASIAIDNARLHHAEIENQRFEKELEVAYRIQQQILPRELPVMAGIQMTAVAIPCHTVGGDFYDVIRINDDKVALVIADVTGKGIPAALLVSTLQASLHAFIEHNYSPTDLVTKLNRVINENSTPEKFITFFICIYDIPTWTLRYVNAGHNHPFILFEKGGIEPLSKGGFCLGVFSDNRYEEGEIRLNPGDSLILYTDGVTEAMNAKNEMYGEARLYLTMHKMLEKNVKEIERSILSDIKLFTNGAPQTDDVTLVLMKVNPLFPVEAAAEKPTKHRPSAHPRPRKTRVSKKKT
jgi:sigma-B regulation protein RsbU (phosphoserine phosphatase)